MSPASTRSERRLRVVGYVRESPGPPEGVTAFAQSEELRRWVRESGHHLVAICQDIKVPGYSLGREGYRALLNIARSGQVEAVLVADLGTLSPDKVAQEIMIADLTEGGVSVISVLAEDQEALADLTQDRVRMVIRDVLAKSARYRAEFLIPEVEEDAAAGPPSREGIISDVIVELIPNPDQGTDSAAQAARPTA